MNLPEVDECLRLIEFKNFLRDAVSNGDVSCSTANFASAAGTEIIRNAVTRCNNDTYPVTINELRAEIIITIWIYLQTKRCPCSFVFPLLHAAVERVEEECNNAKECEADCSNNYTVDEDFNEKLEYDLVKLQKFIINNFEKMLTGLMDNSELGNLKNYAEDGIICKDEKNCKCQSVDTLLMQSYVTASIKNKHRKMEDRHICLEYFGKIYNLNTKSSFYGVFDGHSGATAACYAKNHIPYLLAERLKNINSSCENDDSSYRDAFEGSFLEANEMFSKKHITSGTTAVCALITDNNNAKHLYIAWVGDSKALLVGSNTRLQLVKPHKPDTLEERKRIESSDSGGAVMCVQGHWRVNGILNVSRSIGDYSVSAVIAEPDFVDVPLTKSHDFLLLGTDGLWDHADESQIIECIYQALENQNQNLDDIPKLLIDLAKEGDSQDNITVVLVVLKERCQITSSYKNI